MEIKTIHADTSHVVPTAFDASDYIQLQALWGESKQRSLEHALTELAQTDARHELKTLERESITLADWLERNFSDLMALHAQHTQLSTAVCASLWHKQLVDLIFPTLVALRWQYKLVPDFDANSIYLDIEVNGRINTIALGKALCSTASSTGSDSELDRKFAALVTVFGKQLEEVFAHQRVNQKRFWGNLSNALAQGFTRLSDHHHYDLSGHQNQTIEQWLDTILTKKNNLVEIKTTSHLGRQALFARRKTCCLKYKLNKLRMCKTCSLMNIEEQQQFYEEKYAAKEAS